MPQANTASQLDALPVDGEELSRFLVLLLGGELYGVPLSSVCEVLRLGSIKSVPYMKTHFTGVMNLRGTIISVIDLRVKFGLMKSGQGLIVTFLRDGETIGAIVDDVVAVANIPPSDIKRELAVETKIPLNFFLGVGKMADRLVNLIDIAGVLDKDDMAAIKRKQDLEGRDGT